MAELTVGGKSYALAPLRLAQAAKVIPGVAEVKLDRVEGILLAVAYSLMNGGAFEGESAEAVANTVDVGASSGDVQQAYMAIMLMSGSQKHSTGEDLVADPENKEIVQQPKVFHERVKAELHSRAAASAKGSHLVEPVSD
jgi:hypothetical protein